MRFLIRTGYGIQGGNAHWDFWAGCCFCCAVNQMLQTVKRYGRLQEPNFGPVFNVNIRNGHSQRSFCSNAYDCFYALLCMPCANGYAMQAAGMPFWFGCLTVNGVAGCNILRYVRRSKPFCGGERATDCLPYLFASLLNSFTFYASAPALNWLYTATILTDENYRANRSGCYGCDIVSACSYCCNYCSNGCVCPAPEGRYPTGFPTATDNLIQMNK